MDENETQPLAQRAHALSKAAPLGTSADRGEPRVVGASGSNGTRRDARRMWLLSLAVLAVALAALVPTVGDFGLTWDEPAYRYSQVISQQWWEQLGSARTSRDFRELLDPDALFYYWPYGRHGINFHPPWAGQWNLATYAIFGHWMKDIPARRMATVIQFALAITIGFQFLAKRYGFWVGAVAAESLLLMPRLYGQAHLIDSDIPGMLIWAATAVACWKGLHEPAARRWRIAVGLLIGLAFIEKIAAVVVLLPVLLWLSAVGLPRAIVRQGARAAWIDGVVTTGLMLAPLGLAFQQIEMLQRQLPPPKLIHTVEHWPVSDWPGVILAVPLFIWLVRRLLGRVFPRSAIWGVERPVLETGTAILAFAPVVGWLGNPEWWRETLPRMAHYYMLSAGRQGTLPNISIIYFGQVYEFSLPWHNGWILMAITVPLAILGTAAVGLAWGICRIRRDRLPLYFLVHFLTLPVIRMFPTPAHDGVRLFLPTFFFLAAFAGWGSVWLADAVSRTARLPLNLTRAAVASLVLLWAAAALIGIHPYELSYYNELVGGPRGAWKRGFELSYWYDAFTPSVIDDLNRILPPGAQVDFLNKNTRTAVPVFSDQQSLGSLRGDIVLGRPDLRFPFVWLLAQDSKATSFTRLLHAMRPWYSREPSQLEGARVATVSDPVAVSRAWGLFVLLEPLEASRRAGPAAPKWVTAYAPWLGRLWGDGLIKAPPLAINQGMLDWSVADPESLVAAARYLAAGRPLKDNESARRLHTLITADRSEQGSLMRQDFLSQLLGARAEGLVEAARILTGHRDEVIAVLGRYGYTDAKWIGGYLDRDLAESTHTAKGD
jgi:Dolichyl-phosphate-mannose-protein mannosyltransferase